MASCEAQVFCSKSHRLEVILHRDLTFVIPTHSLGFFFEALALGPSIHTFRQTRIRCHHVQLLYSSDDNTSIGRHQQYLWLGTQRYGRKINNQLSYPLHACCTAYPAMIPTAHSRAARLPSSDTLPEATPPIAMSATVVLICSVKLAMRLHFCLKYRSFFVPSSSNLETLKQALVDSFIRAKTEGTLYQRSISIKIVQWCFWTQIVFFWEWCRNDSQWQRQPMVRLLGLHPNLSHWPPIGQHRLPPCQCGLGCTENALLARQCCWPLLLNDDGRSIQLSISIIKTMDWVSIGLKRCWSLSHCTMYIKDK